MRQVLRATSVSVAKKFRNRVCAHGARAVSAYETYSIQRPTTARIAEDVRLRREIGKLWDLVFNKCFIR